MSFANPKIIWTIAIIIVLLLVLYIGWTFIKFMAGLVLIGGLAYVGWCCYKDYMNKRAQKNYINRRR